MTNMKWMLVWFAVVTKIRFTACGNICLSCNYVVSSQTCNSVVQCGDHQVCGAHMYLSAGMVLYDFGCISAFSCSSKRGVDTYNEPQKRSGDGKVTLCSGCCNDTAICNINGLCGNQKFDLQRDLVCYHCEGSLNPESCNFIEKCRSGQLCTVEKVSHGFAGQRFHLGCSDRNCSNALAMAPIVGKRNSDEVEYKTPIKRADSSCEFCCPTTLCNNKCIPVSTTTSTPTTSTSTSTSTSTTTTSIITSLHTTGIPAKIFSITNTSHIEYGSNVSIKCTGSGNPPVVVVWEEVLLVGNLLPSNVRSVGDSLSIENYQKINDGLYKCSVTNKYGSDFKFVQLSGHVSTTTTLFTTIPTSTPSTLLAQAAPHITTYSNPKTVRLGQNVTLICMASGIPPPNIRWDAKVPLPTPVNMHTSFHGSVVVIEGYTKHNDGQYRCSAQNHLGIDSVIIHISGY